MSFLCLHRHTLFDETDNSLTNYNSLIIQFYITFLNTTPSVPGRNISAAKLNNESSNFLVYEDVVSLHSLLHSQAKFKFQPERTLLMYRAIYAKLFLFFEALQRWTDFFTFHPKGLKQTFTLVFLFFSAVHLTLCSTLTNKWKP